MPKYLPRLKRRKHLSERTPLRPADVGNEKELGVRSTPCYALIVYILLSMYGAEAWENGTTAHGSKTISIYSVDIFSSAPSSLALTRRDGSGQRTNTDRWGSILLYTSTGSGVLLQSNLLLRA